MVTTGGGVVGSGTSVGPLGPAAGDGAWTITVVVVVEAPFGPDPLVVVEPGRPPNGGVAPGGKLDGRKLGDGPPTPGMGIPSAEPTEGGGCA